MSKTLKVIFICLFLMGIVVLGFFKDELSLRAQNRDYANFKEYLTQTKELIDGYELNSFEKQGAIYFNEFLEEPNHHLFIRGEEHWDFWSSIEVNPKLNIDNCDSLIRLLKSPTGYDLIVLKTQGKRQFYFVIHLKNSVSNNSKESLLPHAPYENWAFFTNNGIDEGVPVMLEDDYFLMRVMAPSEQSKNFLFLDFILLLLAGFLFYKLLIPKVTVTHCWAATFIFVLSAYRILYSLGFGFEGLSNYSFFTASLYASSNWLPSLGDLFLNTLLFLSLSILIVQKGDELINRFSNYLWLYAGVLVFVNCLVFSYISALLIDSQLSFNFANIPSIDSNTFIGVGIILLCFLILHYLNNHIFGFIKIKWLEATAAFLVLTLLSQVLLEDNFGFVFMGILNFALSYFIHVILKKKKLKSNMLIEFFAFSIIFTFINSQVNQKKEEDYSKYYLQNTIVEAEERYVEELLEAELSISNDDLLMNINNFKSLTQDNTIKRIQQLYFNLLPSEYEINLYVFDKNGVNILDPDNQVNREYLKTQYNNSAFISQLNYFKPISTVGVPKTYLARYEQCTEGGQTSNGELYIELIPKSFVVSNEQNTNFYSWINKEGEFRNYSYAIYDEQGFLDKRKGNVNYPAALPLDFLNIKDSFIISNEIVHYVEEHPVYSQVLIVSHPKSGLGSFLTNYSFFVVISAVLGLFSLLLIGLVLRTFYLYGSNEQKVKISIYVKEWFPVLQLRNVYLSRKIVLSLVSIVLIAFMVTLFIVLRFIRSSELERFTDSHAAKVEEVINAVESKSFNDILIENSKNGLLLALAKDLGKDILLYNADGNLFVNTSKELNTGAYFAPLVPYNILQELKKSNTGIEVKEFNIGEERFETFNYAILDDNKELQGILSMPHFIPETFLSENASNLVKTLVNLYTILTILAVLVVLFIARNITKPLNLLSDRLAAFKIDTDYKPIAMKGSDEISQLVRQYNHTVVKLKVSTQKLAETERQGAWKEMAKQVAHEIKNPLTPMKLNLQHLQYTLSSSDADSKEKKQKIIEVLLSQIDKLTRLADDFGTFSKITESNSEIVELNSELKEIITLYDKEPNVSIVSHLNDDLNYIKTDKIGFERVLNNIFKNAMQAMNFTGTIDVQTKVIKGFIEIAISDTGKGIAPELEDKIFNPNFSTKTSGMGIGLALSKRIVKNSGGDIFFKSRENVGTTFFIQLPLVKPK